MGAVHHPTWINDKTLILNSGCLDIHVKGVFRGWNGNFSDPNSGTWYGGVIHINSAIMDNSRGKVGLRISGEVVKGSIGSNPNHLRGFVFLRGDQSNTFTGLTEVMDGNVLLLNKNRGATAIRGNIFASRGGAIAIWQSNQIADTSIVTLDGRERMAGFSFDMMNYELTEKFHQLVVKGESRLLFHRKPNKRTLFLDDLLIEYGGVLYVGDWVDGMMKLLVRKDSEHLEESLQRVRFEGYEPTQTKLVSHNSDYWEITPLPEPATYNAVILCGLVAWRRRYFLRIPHPLTFF